MLKEIRFRDTLACEANRNFLKNLIQRGFEKFDGLEFDLDGFRILAREFPLIRDKVGYQLRFIDIFGTNHHNDLLIIELKARYTKRRNIEKIEDQVNEYQELLKENIRDLRNQENFLSIFHFYQKEILNFMHFDYGKYRNIYKLIIFMRKTAPFDISKLNEVPIALTEKKTINTITKKYVNYEIRRVEDINPGFKQLLGQACFSKSFKNPKYRPLPLTIEDKKEKPYFRFESLSKSEFHKKYIQKDKIKNLQNLPKLYFDYDKRVTREDIFNKLNNGRFTIQLFNSGRSFPVFYLEYAPDKYIPFQQIKPRLLERGVMTNEVIANDASGFSARKSKKTIFDEVICFDVGNYTSEIINEYGVKFKRFRLNGARYNIEFELIGPKIRNDLYGLNIKKGETPQKIPALLPHMEQSKIKEQIQKYQTKYGIDPFTKEWISTNLKVKPN